MGKIWALTRSKASILKSVLGGAEHRPAPPGFESVDLFASYDDFVEVVTGSDGALPMIRQPSSKITL